MTDTAVPITDHSFKLFQNIGAFSNLASTMFMAPISLGGVTSSVISDTNHFVAVKEATQHKICSDTGTKHRWVQDQSNAHNHHISVSSASNSFPAFQPPSSNDNPATMPGIATVDTTAPKTNGTHMQGADIFSIGTAMMMIAAGILLTINSINMLMVAGSMDCMTTMDAVILSGPITLLPGTAGQPPPTKLSVQFVFSLEQLALLSLPSLPDSHAVTMHTMFIMEDSPAATCGQGREQGQGQRQG